MISNNIDRMRLSRFAAILLTALTLVSCFKEEPLNAECDITQVSFSTDNPSGIFFNLSDTSKTVPSTDSTITFVVRRNHDAQGNAVTLHGDDVKTHPLIVAIADMGTVAPVDEWTPFALTFRYTGTIDYDLLDSREYSLAIVFSSSNEGDKFEGAIGSELFIDKVSIICRKEQ